MQWTPVDLETIAGILDDLSVNADSQTTSRSASSTCSTRTTSWKPSRTPIRHISMPTPCACSPAYCALASPVADPALALTACPPVSSPRPDTRRMIH